MVTTRNESVASVMQTVSSFKLKPICEEDCWKLFVKHAFHNVDLCRHPKLEEIGKQVVESAKVFL